MPVYQVENEMPYEEFLKWITYFNRNPPGWQDDHRAYMLLSAQGVKEKPENLFPSLRAKSINKEKQIKPDQAMPNDHLISLMSRAKDGDGSGWEYERAMKNDDSNYY